MHTPACGSLKWLLVAPNDVLHELSVLPTFLTPRADTTRLTEHAFRRRRVAALRGCHRSRKLPTGSRHTGTARLAVASEMVERDTPARPLVSLTTAGSLGHLLPSAAVPLACAMPSQATASTRAASVCTASTSITPLPPATDAKSTCCMRRAMPGCTEVLRLRLQDLYLSTRLLCSWPSVRSRVCSSCCSKMMIAQSDSMDNDHILQVRATSRALLTLHLHPIQPATSLCFYRHPSSMDGNRMQSRRDRLLQSTAAAVPRPQPCMRPHSGPSALIMGAPWHCWHRVVPARSARDSDQPEPGGLHTHTLWSYIVSKDRNHCVQAPASKQGTAQQHASHIDQLSAL